MQLLCVLLVCHPVAHVVHVTGSVCVECPEGTVRILGDVRLIPVFRHPVGIACTDMWHNLETVVLRISDRFP